MKVLLLLLTVVASDLFGQAPPVFEASRVVVGAKRIPTLWFHAVGKWAPDVDSGDSPLVGPMSAEIRCFKAFGFCERVGALVAPGPSATVIAIEDFDIVRWDSREVVAEDNEPPCVVDTLRIDFGTKQVTATRALKSRAKDASCREFSTSDEWTAFLVGPKNEEKEKMREKANEK